MSLLKNYWIQLVLTTVLAFSVSMTLFQIRNPYFDNPNFYIATVFFVLTTIIVNVVFTKGEKQSKEFIFKIMAISMGRLLLCMIAVFIYFLADKPHALPFATHFMIQYIIFTIFELNYLLKYIKQTS